MALNIRKLLIRGISGLAVVALVILIAFTGWRETNRATVAKQRAIHSPNGIEALETVSIGGIDQWISVRGQDTGNPVLLYLHGGPGTPMMPFAHVFQTPWEKHFTVVQWDQRLTGKTYRANDPDRVAANMTFERMVEDARELSEHLASRFNKRKIFVLGHSWGSMMGIPLVKKHPELFHAYIGTGQVISVHENEVVGYEKALAVARETKNLDAIAELEGIAPYPHPEIGTLDTRDTLRKWQQELGLSLAGKKGYYREMLFAGLRSPDYGLRDLITVFSMPREHRTTKIPAMARTIDEFDLWPLGPRFETPVVFLLGRLDWQVPSVIAARYFENIEAPYKNLVWFEQSAHSPPSEEPAAFLEALLEVVVRPLANPEPGHEAIQ